MTADDAVERFVLDGATVEVPVAALNPTLRGRLADGGYEGHERAHLRAHLRPGDWLLDLGAGIGLVSLTGARIVGAAAVTAVEPNPALTRCLRRNLRRAAGPGATVIAAAATAPGDRRTETALHVHPGFWSASTLPRRARNATASPQVKARPLDKLIARSGATALAMDIEGAEADLLRAPLPAQLRLIVVELHPSLYGAARRDALLAGLAAQGFARAPGPPTEEVFALLRG